VYVKQEYRGTGVGNLLLQEALNRIKRNKAIIKVKLAVNSEQTAAKTLYEKHGFKVVGTSKKELKIENKYYDLLMMEKFV